MPRDSSFLKMKPQSIMMMFFESQNIPPACQPERERYNPLPPEKISLEIGYDTELLRWGIRHPISCNIFAPPHLCLIGASGSAKSCTLELLTGRLALHKPFELVFANYKGSDFRYLSGCSRYYSYDAVGEALDYVYEKMLSRIRNVNPVKYQHPVILIFDEMSAYQTSLSRSELDATRQKLSSLLMLGRGVSVCCILALQRADAEFFAKSRDNLGSFLALGKLSKESISMIAPEYKERLLPQKCGKGYLITAGSEPRAVTIPRTKNTDKLQRTIIEALNRSFD